MHIWMKLGYIVSHNSYNEFQLSKMMVKAGLRMYTYNMIIEHSVFAMKSHPFASNMQFSACTFDMQL